jgi:hypothetical protein
MAHFFHIQAWEMTKLTPWEHNSLVDATKATQQTLTAGSQ